jgi:two-component system response regulator FixJ
MRESRTYGSVRGARDEIRVPTATRAYEERLERATLQARVLALTPREREVFELVAAGEPNKAIARQLGISFCTVELHRAHIIEKLQARSLSDLIRMGIILNSNPTT